MPLVTIKVIEGRTAEQKRGMAEDVTKAIVKNIGCPSSAVNIEIVEMKPQNFAMDGKLWCDTH
ncbi:MAG: 2-hydroxymuconate tautomerase [Dehalococcoidales bacterium]|jgi:4-oxalocrotonate tautomerase